MYNTLSILYLSDITAFANGLIILFKDYSSTAGVNNNSTSARQQAFYLYFFYISLSTCNQIRLIKVTFVLYPGKNSLLTFNHISQFSPGPRTTIFFKVKVTLTLRVSFCIADN